MKYFTKKK